MTFPCPVVVAVESESGFDDLVAGVEFFEPCLRGCNVVFARTHAVVPIKRDAPGLLAESSVVAYCDAAGFGQQLKWEVSRGGALFPHLYAVLPLGAVERYWTVTKQGDRFAFPDTY